MRARLLPALAPLLGVVLSACATSQAATAPDLDARRVELARLNDAIAEAAERQARIEPAVTAALVAVRDIDRAIERLRDADRLDDARETWPTTRAAVDDLDAHAAVEEDLVRLLDAVAAARKAITRAESALDDPWEAAYVRAQDDVLVALRDHAELTGELVTALDQHRPTYVEIVGRADRFVEERWFYRTHDEAADAFEVALGSLRPDLDAARTDLGRLTEARTRTADAVNRASDRAREVWATRPSGIATAGDGA